MEIVQKTEGVYVHEKEKNVTVVLPTLDVVTLSRKEYILWNLIDGKKSMNELYVEIKESLNISEDEIQKVLKKLSNVWLIHPIPHEGEKDFSFEERLLMKKSEDKFLLLEKNVIEKDESFQYISFLPLNGKFTLDLILNVFKEVIPYASRSPLISFFDAEQYMDAALLRKIIRGVTSHMLYDRPFVVLEVNSAFIHDIDDVLSLLEPTPYQCLDIKTLVKMYLGDEVSPLEKYDLSKNDVNLFVLVKMENAKDIENFKYLNEYPGKSYGVSFKISQKEQIQDVERFLEKYFIPVFLRFTSCDLFPYFFSHFLNTERVLFAGDDLYRIKGACIKNYFPVTHCGAGKRKIVFTPDGKVYPCLPAVEEGYILGHIEEGILSIMKGDAVLTVQDTISSRFKECNCTCCFAFFCGGCILKKRCALKREILNNMLKERKMKMK